MKLVNPVGRDVSTFDTQANFGNCSCICSTMELHFNGMHTGRDNDNCGCQCSYGDENFSANFDKAYGRIH